MAKTKQKLIRAGQRALLLAGGVLFIVLLGAGMKKQRDIHCNRLAVDIEYISGSSFLNENQVLDLATAHQTEPLIGKAYEAIDFRKVEAVLNENPYIKKAEAYGDTEGEIHIQVSQMQPILRIINSRGVSYYLTDNGYEIPLSDNFTPRVIIATGDIPREGEVKDKLLRLMDFIRADDFWLAAVDQIHVEKDDRFVLRPVVGNHKVVLGDVDEEMPERFEKLKRFYKEGLNKLGWDKYASIDLQYQDQVVCTKR